MKTLLGVILVAVMGLGVTACSSGGSGGTGGWCYLRTTNEGASVYAWPIGAYEPVPGGECSQLADDFGSQVGYTFTVQASEPAKLPDVPQCAGDLDGMTTSLSSASNAAAENLCNALSWYPPVP